MKSPDSKLVPAPFSPETANKHPKDCACDWCSEARRKEELAAVACNAPKAKLGRFDRPQMGKLRR